MQNIGQNGTAITYSINENLVTVPAGKSLILRDNNVKEKGSDVVLNLGITNW